MMETAIHIDRSVGGKMFVQFVLSLLFVVGSCGWSENLFAAKLVTWESADQRGVSFKYPECWEEKQGVIFTEFRVMVFGSSEKCAPVDRGNWQISITIPVGVPGLAYHTKPTVTMAKIAKHIAVAKIISLKNVRWDARIDCLKAYMFSTLDIPIAEAGRWKESAKDVSPPPFYMSFLKNIKCDLKLNQGK